MVDRSELVTDEEGMISWINRAISERGYLVVATTHEKPIGYIYSGDKVQFNGMEMGKEYRFMVMSETDKQDYINQWRLIQPTHSLDFINKRIFENKFNFFYRVSTD